jgi:hypothetical protein
LVGRSLIASSPLLVAGQARATAPCFSISRILRVVGTTASGLRLTESIPFSTRKAAKSGLSEGAWPQIVDLIRRVRAFQRREFADHLPQGGVLSPLPVRLTRRSRKTISSNVSSMSSHLPGPDLSPCYNNYPASTPDSTLIVQILITSSKLRRSPGPTRHSSLCEARKGKPSGLAVRSIAERPRGFVRPTRKRHYNSLPKTSLEGTLGRRSDLHQV